MKKLKGNKLSFLITTIIGLVVILGSYQTYKHMHLGSIGIFFNQLCFAAIAFLTGLVFLVMPKTKQYAQGIFIAIGLFGIIGFSVCTLA